MSVRVWGNQHGHGATLDGWHLLVVERLAEEWGVSPEEVLNKIIREYIERVFSEHKKENDA